MDFRRVNRLYNIIRLYQNFWTRLLNHRFLKKRDILFKLRNGLTIRVESNSDDDGIIEDMFLNKPYIQRGIRVGRGDTVFDVGAQKGIFSLFCLTNGANVFAYEPMPKNYSYLVENLRSNKFRCKTFNLGLSDKNGKQKLFLSEGSGSHSIFKPDSQCGKRVEIKTRTLDSEINRLKIKKIDLLKLDCEGAEYPIILNTKSLNKIDKIAMEYHKINGFHIDRIIQKLSNSGFNVTLNPPNLLYATKKSQSQKVNTKKQQE